ncbi:MAG: SAM-dependent methyltransferase [Myxococcota bacterium]
MREGIPSGTSFAVALARGLGVDERAIDPYASRWLPGFMGRLAAAPRRLGVAGKLVRQAVRAGSFGMVDHMVLRTEVIDAKLTGAIEAGVSQVVILGAGLDARAWRMPILESIPVFEVDHPSTQSFKRARVRGHQPPTEIRYVPVDFQREQFSTRLLETGFDTDRPTAWIWEGVAMYLPEDAVRDSVAQMTALSPRGSHLLMTYRTPDRLPFGRLGKVVIPMAFAAGGEPLGVVFTPSELAQVLAPHWQVSYDADAFGWRAFTPSSADPALSFLSERFADAERSL